ncbi:hypothetical protein HF319_02545 [Xanthomonas sp. Kuri4-1]
MLVAALFLPAPVSMACSCNMYNSLEDAQARATAAVQATMVSVRSKVVQQGDMRYTEAEVVRWRIDESLRGPLTAGQEIETQTLLYPAACGNQVLDTTRRRGSPIKKAWWLFFQWVPEDKAPWFIATCSRSQPVDPATSQPAS